MIIPEGVFERETVYAQNKNIFDTENGKGLSEPACFRSGPGKR